MVVFGGSRRVVASCSSAQVCSGVTVSRVKSIVVNNKRGDRKEII